ncbi:hypothetical protein CALCODRAFT_493542 [Calocera cornea HHB12733]|uniref:Extracellular membrane protein CFEM domain-containing protein n=1 Tax=Calocera cornea HHB12733 TaxID=1353952 RepID=A0A165HQ86_9BASI|nr:hypothetical protein CALCODRAFT_493542 [Calocera cornea HHB12733]
MKLLSAIVCTLALLIAGANANPSVIDFFDNFETVVRRSMTIPPSQIKYKRASGLLPFAPDEVSVFKRQSFCTSNCSSSSDTSILQNSIANATCALDTGCVCNAISQLSTGCQTCILEAEGYSTSSYQSVCSAATSVIAVGSAVATAEEAVASGTGSCVSQCGNETELAGLDAVVGCGNNALCICSATNVTTESALTPTCLTCLLQGAGTTISGLQSMCDAALAGTVSTYSGSSTSGSASSTSSSSSAANTGSSTGSATTASGSGSGSGTSSSASAAATTAHSAAGRAERMYALEATALLLLAGVFLWLA